ncbi:hypothetical protein GGX14DRAFT_542118 [Mycena pura]|uniref:Uncharacterized protein n=1 Tax=Mycena pura TaxID=153505 RepID=A0AAD6YFY7_9AGAR|nr:hypothetical protein GGX14DRAFT_542118 [Mycena pura]
MPTPEPAARTHPRQATLAAHCARQPHWHARRTSPSPPPPLAARCTPPATRARHLPLPATRNSTTAKGATGVSPGLLQKQAKRSSLIAKPRPAVQPGQEFSQPKKVKTTSYATFIVKAGEKRLSREDERASGSRDRLPFSMAEAPKTPDAANTPRTTSNEPAAYPELTPRLAATAASDATQHPRTTEGITASYFGRITDLARSAQRANARSGARGRRGADDDETGSVMSDFTELSTKAQAGSLAPTPPLSPESEPPIYLDPVDGQDHERQGGEADPGIHADDLPDEDDSDLSRFIHVSHADATMPTPPKVCLDPRTHPLGREGAQAQTAYGGVPLSEEALAAMDAEDAAAAHDNEEWSVPAAAEDDDNMSDEPRDWEGGESQASKIKNRVKGGAKLISGRIRRDPERMQDGKELLAES